MSQQQDNQTAQGLRDFSTNTSEYNRQRFFVESILREILNTSALVRVDSCTAPGSGGPAGSVSATPLVAQTDAQGNKLPMASIPSLPFMRYQAGVAAIILDPVAGDQGVAVFFKNDSSTVGTGTTEPQRPGSTRSFSQSDGAYLPGVQNKAPTVWIELRQNNTITIHAPAGVTVETDQNCVVNAGQGVTVTAGENVNISAGAECNITAPVINLNGALNAQAQDGGDTTATFTGTLNATQDVTANSISLHNHTHTGVEPGSGSTGEPQ